MAPAPCMGKKKKAEGQKKKKRIKMPILALTWWLDKEEAGKGERDHDVCMVG